MHIFVREMKAYRKSIVFWSIGMLFTIFAGMSKYSVYTESEVSMNLILGKIPRTLRVVLGFADFDVTKISGFYGMLYFYILVMVAIHGVMLGASIIAKEERDKTIEFLMVKPITRSRIISEKLLAAFVNVLILNMVTCIGSIGIVGSYNNNGDPIVESIEKLMIVMFVIQLLFLVMGSAIAAVNRKPKTSASLATSILLVTFILSILVDLNEKFDKVRYITPFQYFSASDLLQHKEIPVFSVLLSCCLIGIFLCVTYIFYGKRDMTI